jgi:phospholipid/cholesterol/gamma-HCH transport system substrate-binding protein
VLAERRFDLMDTLATVASFVASLGEAVASGPYFKVMLVNLLPGQILQPFVDAAFKKRGIDPEKFWGDAGLPAWRFPDPNAARFPNGAPAPGPAVLEGTPEHPGPAVRAGTPCSYTPPPDGIPTAANPLPCAGLSVGPFGNNPYGANYGPPDVVTSDPNVHGPQPSPGVPSAAIPGQLPPDMPGAPAALPPAPPGARIVPVGPMPPQPPDFTPGIAPLPPALTGPPPPPGPGPDAGPAGTPPLPGNPPFLPPLSQGQG